MRVCPAGWYLPSDAEWGALVKYVDPNASGDDRNNAGMKLKSTTGWNDGGNGTDDYDFSALPGGGEYGGNFYDAGIRGHWWSVTEDDADYARYRGMYYDEDGVYRNFNFKSYLFSLRCSQDSASQR